jgi:plastocyanin
MKGCLVGCCVLLLLALVIVGKSYGWDLTYVQILNNAFSPDQVEIIEGDSVYFQNKTGARGIVICLGRQGKCTPHASGPSDLQNRGITLGVAETRSVEFDKQGSYAVTFPQRTKMNLLVNVRQSDNTSDGSSGGGGSGGSSGSGGYSGGSTGGDNYGGYGGNGGSNDDENGSNSSGGGGDDGGE